MEVPHDTLNTIKAAKKAPETISETQITLNTSVFTSDPLVRDKDIFES